MSQDFHSTPAEITGIDDLLAATYFNRAVFAFGSRLEGEIERVKAKHSKSATRQNMAVNMLFRRWLGDEAAKFAGR